MLHVEFCVLVEIYLVKPAYFSTSTLTLRLPPSADTHTHHRTIPPHHFTPRGSNHFTIVSGVMKMGNIAPRVGIEFTYFTFRASAVPTITPLKLPSVTLHTTTFLCSALLQRSVQITTLVCLES